MKDDPFRQMQKLMEAALAPSRQMQKLMDDALSHGLSHSAQPGGQIFV